MFKDPFGAPVGRLPKVAQQTGTHPPHIPDFRAEVGDWRTLKVWSNGTSSWGLAQTRTTRQTHMCRQFDPPIHLDALE